MNDHHHNHHRQRPHPLALPTRHYPSPPSYPFAQTPTPTPSKSKSNSRRPSLFSFNSNANSTPFSLFILLLFSLQPLYSILPFLQSTPSSFSLFPFSFLVSLLSFFLSLFFFSFSKKTTPSSSSSSLFTLLFSSSSSSHGRLLPSLCAKSFLLALTFLLRFQSLRSCGTGPTILAEFSGSLAAQFASSRLRLDRVTYFRGCFALLFSLFLFSNSWDRAACFPFNGALFNKVTFSPFSIFYSDNSNCVRIVPMLLPFLSGLLGHYERSSTNWGPLRQLGRRRVRLISLFLTSILLFVPAVVSFFAVQGDTIMVRNLGWPLLNTVIFGVILTENYTEDNMFGNRDLRKDFAITFACTLVLELFYFPELSLSGYLLCGFLLWISVRDLGSSSLNYPQLGSDVSESFSSMIMNPIHHILTERKSRKIALFLLINTAYMVVEFVAGFMSNSLGLISDACHMLFDCAALAIGLYASYISRQPANYQFNYGRGRFEVLSGYVNAVFLVLVGVLIVLESFERILDPQEISTSSLLVVSVGGLLVNVVGLIFFHEEHHHAHGGAGTCSHSHHHHDHVDDHVHDHKDHHHVDDHVHGHHHEHQNSVISFDHDASHVKSCSSHQLCKEHANHADHHIEKPIGELKKTVSSPSSCGKDHHDHDHDHDHHDDHHDHDHHDDHHDHDHEHHDDHHAHINSHGEDNRCGSTGSKHDQHLHGHHDDHHEHSHHIETRTDALSRQEYPSSEAKLPKESRNHSHIDHNMEGIFLHVLADTLGSVGVVISTLLIKYKGWLVADPACSIFISVLIISSVIPLLRNSAEILLQRVPRAHEKDLKVAMDDVMKVKGILGVRNVHVWSFTNTDVVGTLHLHISAEIDKDFAKERVSHILHDAGIKDLTLQVEHDRAK